MNLVTFGCSWTYGVGVGYKPGMSKADYNKIAQDRDLADSLSWRAILCKELGWTNINFATGGSSNQKQQRFAKQYFASPLFMQSQSEHLVLWGLTSTARNEMYSTQLGQLKNFHYHDTELDLARSILMQSYNHDDALRELSLEIVHWNNFFDALSIDNLWFDSFNHHDYKAEWPGPKMILNTKMPRIERLINRGDRPRDLLSMLAEKYDFKSEDKNYHYSFWELDSTRIKYLVDKEILNPISHHPTRQGHEDIAEFMLEKIKGVFPCSDRPTKNMKNKQRK